MTAPTLPRSPRLRPSTLALALEPRMMFDAAAVATGNETAAQAEAQQAAPANQAPTLTAEASHATFTVGTSDSAGVAVFSNSSASTVDSGQTFDTLVIKVNSSGGKEALVVDGKSIALSSGQGVTDNNGYVYKVSTSAGQTTLEITLASSSSNSAADLKALIDGLRYSALDNSVDSGTRTITLSRLKDSGGTADGGQDTTALAVSSDITLVNDTNRAPVLSSPGVPSLSQSEIVQQLGNAKEVVYSSDGKHLYAANASGVLVGYSVDNNGVLSRPQIFQDSSQLSSIIDLTLSADGKSLYALSGTKITTLDVASDGQLSYRQSTNSGQGDVVALTLSGDGQQLYVTTRVGGLLVFGRDTGTGELSATASQILNEGALGGGRSRTVISVGNYVYVVSLTSLVTLERGSDGKLTKLLDGTLSVEGLTSATQTSLAASADGRFIYLSDASSQRIHIFELRDVDGEKELALVDRVNLSGVNAVSLSNDGSRLFATSSAGTLSVYSVASDGTLKLSGTLIELSAANAVSVSPDGKSIIVAGESLSRFSDVLNYFKGSNNTFASNLSLSDVNLDRLNGGNGNYQGASFTVQRSGTAAAQDSFGFVAGNGLSLSGSDILKDGAVVASFSQAGGTLTVSISAALDKASVNQLLHQLTYSNTSTADGTLVSLAVVANDGQLASQALSVALLISPGNTAPTLSTNVISVVPYDTAKVQTLLFNGTSVNTGEAGQTLLALGIDISGLASAANEFLIVDGTRIDLSTSSSGTTTNGYRYSYSLSNGLGSLSIGSDSGLSTAKVQALVNGLAYVNDSARAVTGSRTINLTTLRDNGGGNDTAQLAVSTTLAIAVNNAPSVQASVDDPDSNLFYLNGSLSGYSDYVSSVSLSADGKTLLVAGNSGSALGGISYLRVYQRDASSGALTLSQTFTQGATDDPATSAIEVNGLNTISTLTLSADGNKVYVAGYTLASSVYNASLLLFTRDSTSGALSFDSVVATQGQASGGLTVSGLNGAITEIVLSADGKSLYTINGQTPNDASTSKSEVAMFSRDASSGALSYLGSYVGGSTALGLNGPTGLVLSADGRSAYISNNAGSQISVLARDTSTGVLTYVTYISRASIAAGPDAANLPSNTQALSGLQDIVISADDAFVYVTNGGNAFISVFHRESDGSLRYISSLNTYDNGYSTSLTLREMVLSSDGKSLYVSSGGGQSILVFSRNSSTGALTFVENIKGNKNYNHLAVSADGMNIYTGTSSFVAGLDVLSARANSFYSDRSPSTFAGGISVGDIDFDALNSYSGASLVIVRSSGASSDDLFGLKADNGLTLENGKVLKDGNAIADFNVVGGKLTLTFTAAVDKAQVNAVLQQLTYANDTDNPPAKVALQISLSDGSKSASSLVVLKLNHAPVTSSDLYTPPAGSANTAYSLVLPANLFSDIDGDNLTWSVSGLPAGLTFDAQTRTISGTPTGASNSALTLSVVDEHSNSSTLQVTLSVASDPAQAPTLTGDSTSVENGGIIAQDIFDGANDSQLSSDGKFAYITSLSSSGSSSISVFSRAADGKLTLVQSLFDSSISGLAGALRLSLSTDQGSVYVVGGDANSLLVFQRDSSSGLLTLSSTLVGSNVGAGESITSVASQGNRVFVASDQSVRVYQQASDGSLSLRNTYSDGVGAIEGLQGVNQLLVSADGQYLFAAALGDNSIATALRINADGSLTFINSLAGEPADSLYFIKAMSLSPDGKNLYAINNDQTPTLEILAIGSDGRLSKVASLTLGSAASDLVVAADGSALFLTGSTIEIFLRARDGSLSPHASFGPWQNPWGDIAFSDLNSLALSPDGKQLYITGSYSWAPGLLTLNINLPDITYTEGSAAVALLPSANLSDPQLDARNDYQGASLLIGREGTPQAEDTFGFLNGNDLSLSGNQILKNGVVIASFSQSNGVLNVLFTASTSKADAQNVLRQISYSNSSNDPAHAGARVNFGITLNDGDGNTVSVVVKTNLVDVNNPATIKSTPTNPTYREDGDYVTLFKDTQIDTIEAGQNIWRVVLSIDNASTSDVLMVGSAKIPLDKATSGAPTASNGMGYMVNISNGVTTVTLFLMTPASEAAAVIDSIRYGSSASDLSGSRSVSLSVHEYPGGATTLTDKSTITLAPAAETNSAPVLDSGSTTVGYVERAEAVLIAPGAVVSDRQMDLLNGGQGNYNGATLNITLGNGASSLDQLSLKAGNGLSLDGKNLHKDGVIIGQVSNANGVLSIRFSDGQGGTPTTGDVQNTLRQITYASDSHTPAANVAVSISLADRALTSSVAQLSVNIQAINDTPVLNADPKLSQGELALLQSIGAVSGLDRITHAGFSSDGLSVYVNDGKGAIALFSRNPDSGQLTFVSTLSASATGLDHISQVTVSLDGSKVYVVGQRDAINEFGEEYQIPVLTVFARDPLTGQLTLGQKVLSDDSTQNSLFGVISLAESSDGKNLYVLTQEGLSTLHLVNGQLTYLGTLGNNAQDEPFMHQTTAVHSAGDYVFVLADPGSKDYPNTLIAYKRGSDGSLTLAGYVRDTLTDSAGKPVSMADPKYLAVSADGATLYVAGASSVQVFHFDSASGTFQSLGSPLTGLGSISDLTLSSDGALLYVSSSAGSLSRYSTADQRLTLIDSLNRSNPGDVLLSADGGVILLGDAVTVLRAQALPATVYIDGGSAVVIGAHLSLSDAELDAANNGAGNYQDARIVLERSPAAVSTDRFGLVESNGISLVDGQLLKGGLVVGSFVESNGRLTITFTAALSSAEAKAVLTHLTYASSASHTNASTLISLNLRLNDGSLDSRGQSVSVEIQNPNANLPPVVGPAPYTPPPAAAGQPYSVVLPADLFSDPNGDLLTWSIGALPSGLSFDAASRTLSGTPLTSGVLNLTLTATDPAGASVARSLSLTVEAATVVTPPVEPGVPGTAPTQGSVTPVVPITQPSWQPGPQPPAVRDFAAPAPALPKSLDSQSGPRPGVAPVPGWVGLGSLNGLNPGSGFDAYDSLSGNRTDSALGNTSPLVRPAEVGSPTLSTNRSTVGAMLALETGASFTRFQLPEGLFSARDAKLQVSLRLANGLGLPGWIRFDSRTGQVQLDNRQLANLERLKLVLVARDAEGQEVRIPVDLAIQRDGSASLQTSPPESPATDAQAGLSSHLQASGQSGLLARGQALLKALLGDQNAA